MRWSSRKHHRFWSSHVHRLLQPAQRLPGRRRGGLWWARQDRPRPSSDPGSHFLRVGAAGAFDLTLSRPHTAGSSLFCRHWTLGTHRWHFLSPATSALPRASCGRLPQPWPWPHETVRYLQIKRKLKPTKARSLFWVFTARGQWGLFGSRPAASEPVLTTVTTLCGAPGRVWQEASHRGGLVAAALTSLCGPEGLTAPVSGLEGFLRRRQPLGTQVLAPGCTSGSLPFIERFLSFLVVCNTFQNGRPLRRPGFSK